MLLAAGCGGSPPRLRAFGAGPQPDLEPRAQFCGVRSAVFTAAMRAHFSPAALLQLSPLLSLPLVLAELHLTRRLMSCSSPSLSPSPSFSLVG